MRSLVGVLVISACYRGEVAPAASPGAPLAMSPACSTDDDLQHPVIDRREGRLRVHSSSPLTSAPRRTGRGSWFGPAIPRYIPRRVGSLDLMVLDQVDGGYLALYREPYDLGSCQLADDTNCSYQVRHYRDDGRLAWALPLAPLMSRGDHLEVQDIRLSGGVLYFNEACQSYSKEADGDCSSLVAVDPVHTRVLWRTPPLTSNNRFAVSGCYIVAGYGFTAEPDAVHLIDRSTGQVLQRLPVSTAPESYRVGPTGQVDVTLYSGAVGHFRLDASAGKLVALDPGGAFGGAAYGGAMYGGAMYGGAAYGGAAYGGMIRPRP